MDLSLSLSLEVFYDFLKEHPRLAVSYAINSEKETREEGGVGRLTRKLPFFLTAKRKWGTL